MVGTCVTGDRRQRREAAAQVVEEAGADGWVDGVEARDVPGHFAGTFVETGPVFAEDGRIGCYGKSHLLPLKILEVLDGHLQDVSFFQL